MKKSPRESAWFPSKLFFCWLWKLLRLGSKRELELDDVYQVLDDDRSQLLGDKLEKTWNEEVTKSEVRFGKWNELPSNESDKNPLLGNYKEPMRSKSPPRMPSLGRVLFRVFGTDFLLLGIIAFMDECVIRILQPLFLGELIRYFGGELSPLEGYLYAAGVILTSAWYITEHHPFFFGLQHVGMRSRLAVSSLVYRKVLKLSVTALQKTTTGQMVNFLSNDMSRFDQAPLMTWYIIVAPVQLAIVIYILWGYYSYVCLVGVGFLILFVPFQSLMGNLFGRMRKAVAGRTDKRIRIINEIISAIRVIKMYTWEDPYAQMVAEARSDEIRALTTVANLKAINLSLFNVLSKIVIFITLLTYVLTGNSLTAEKVFVTLALYNNVRLVLTLFFPFGIASAAEFFISVRRLQNFLLLEEKKVIGSAPKTPTIDQSTPRNWRVSGGAIGLTIKNLQAKWSPDQDEWTLDNISLQVRRGQLVAVIGTVGSAKSSLLHAILGELPTSGGQIEVNGGLAYASQEPWIFSGTVRSNILLGKPYNAAWYSRVVHACALSKDFDLLPQGDQSLVGDRGISLSGGQKARVNLARAVYADREIYLLDDPLSAVDAEVGKHLFERCIRGILSSKVVILVTHQIQFLKPSDRILILDNGKMKASGTLLGLKQSGIDFAELLHQTEEAGTCTVLPEASPAAYKPSLRKISSDVGLASRLASMEMSGCEEFRNPVTEFEDCLTRSHGPITFVSQKGEDEDAAFGSSGSKSYGTFGKVETMKEAAAEEVRSSGSISFGLYWKYMRSGSNCCYLFILLFSTILAQTAFTGSDFFLQFWTELEENPPQVANSSKITNDTTASTSWWTSVEIAVLTDRNVQIGIYSAIILLLFITTLMRTLTFTKICLTASVNLHKNLFKGVLRSPMVFFETNPVGRILNRFSRDIGVIDEYLPQALFDTWEIPFQGLGVFVVVGLMSPILIVPALFLLVLFQQVRKFYLKTARSLKRLESTTRSPVFTHLSASFQGLATIRALEVQQNFCRDFDQLQDDHSGCWYLFLATSRWVAVSLDWVAVLYIAIVTLSFMWSDLDGSQVGLAVTSALTLTGMFQWGVRQSTEAENHMVSVERVFEYANLEPEPPLKSSPENMPPSDWPQKGEIQFDHLFLRYGLDDPVLKDITLTIKPKEKIGIVGRTGAGKSSIISVLFRMVDPCGGTVVVDEVNILCLGLHDLRSRISIIPQEPVLFTGSLRRNLDPFSRFGDLDLWNVLDDVHLKEAVQEQPLGLQSPVSEGGSNWSVGQRQLICLARAILTNNRILILDEATANVDHATDGLIQATIRTKFQNCTVLTVAHRLNTVMDSDRILVLDAGKLVEFDHPWALLQNREGALSQLVQQTGTASAEALAQVAKQAYENVKRQEDTASNMSG